MLGLFPIAVALYVVICVLLEVFFPAKRKLYDENDESWWP